MHLSPEKKGDLYNTYHELLPKKLIVRRSLFRASYLYHPKQYQYLQHPVLWVALNIRTIALRRRLKRLQSQHPMKQVGLTIHSKTSMVRKSDNIIYKMQKPCNENPILKSADLLQTQTFIES